MKLNGTGSINFRDFSKKINEDIILLYFIMYIFALFTWQLINYNDKHEKIESEFNHVLTNQNDTNNKRLDESLLVVKKLSIDLKPANFLDVITKFILNHIDKLTLIIMYSTAVNKISIINLSMNYLNLVLILIFLVQLIFPKTIKNLCYIIILTIELLILIQYHINSN